MSDELRGLTDDLIRELIDAGDIEFAMYLILIKKVSE